MLGRKVTKETLRGKMKGNVTQRPKCLGLQEEGRRGPGGENGCCGGEALGFEKRTPLRALGRALGHALGGGAFPNLDLGSDEEVCRWGQRFTAEGDNRHPLQSESSKSVPATRPWGDNRCLTPGRHVPLTPERYMCLTRGRYCGKTHAQTSPSAPTRGVFLAPTVCLHPPAMSSLFL